MWREDDVLFPPTFCVAIFQTACHRIDSETLLHTSVSLRLFIYPFAHLLSIIMPTQIELNTDYQNAERFPAWMALSVFSAVCLAAVNSRQTTSSRDSADKWVLSVTVLSMILSFGAVIMYLMMRSVFVGEITEVALVSHFEIIMCFSYPFYNGTERMRFRQKTKGTYTIITLLFYISTGCFPLGFLGWWTSLHHEPQQRYRCGPFGLCRERQSLLLFLDVLGCHRLHLRLVGSRVLWNVCSRRCSQPKEWIVVRSLRQQRGGHGHVGASLHQSQLWR